MAIKIEQIIKCHFRFKKKKSGYDNDFRLYLFNEIFVVVISVDQGCHHCHHRRNQIDRVGLFFVALEMKFTKQQ